MYILEGNIGAGKSTFLQIMQDALPDIYAVPEPIDGWQKQLSGQSLLANFYREPQRWAYTFETLTLMSRIRDYRHDLSSLVAVAERSIFSGYYCFARNSYEQGFLSDLEWALYKEWFSFFMRSQQIVPHGFIYLRVEPEIAYERLRKRNRYAEKTVPLSYLRQIHEKHEQFLVHKNGTDAWIKDVPVLIVDCNKEFETDALQRDNHLALVRNFVGTEKKGHPTNCLMV